MPPRQGLQLLSESFDDRFEQFGIEHTRRFGKGTQRDPLDVQSLLNRLQLAGLLQPSLICPRPD
jgi:hypothetical protein